GRERVAREGGERADDQRRAGAGDVAEDGPKRRARRRARHGGGAAPPAGRKAPESTGALEPRAPKGPHADRTAGTCEVARPRGRLAGAPPPACICNSRNQRGLRTFRAPNFTRHGGCLSHFRDPTPFETNRQPPDSVSPKPKAPGLARRAAPKRGGPSPFRSTPFGRRRGAR